MLRCSYSTMDPRKLSGFPQLQTVFLFSCFHSPFCYICLSFVTEHTKCLPDVNRSERWVDNVLTWKQNLWHLPYCCLIGGSEFCLCIWQGRDFCPPRYLQYRAWIFARNFSRSGSNRSCRKMDHFIGELIVSYSFPLIYSLTQAHALLLKVTCVLWPAQKVILAHSPVAVLTLMFTLHVVNIITKQILIASFLILFLFQECVELSSHCCEGSLPLLNWP